LSVLALAHLHSVAAEVSPRSHPPARPAALFHPTDEALLDEIQRTAFLYFLEQTHPVTGLVRDRARADGSPSEGKASIAASGFAFAAWAVAVERGWTDRETALERIRLMLRFLVDGAPRRQGFFYHFMEMETGERAWKCEVSSIDTALCLAGALLAREYFGDAEVTRMVDHLSATVEWSWFLNEGPLVSLGWHDETGFSRYRWAKYSEHMVMSLLGLGADRFALPSVYWDAWDRVPVGTYAGLRYLQEAPLFIHQFAHAFFDFRDKRDGYADYFRNSVLATRAQHAFSHDLRREFPTWGDRLWGVTASDSETGYKAWGGPPRTTDYAALDGTVVPCAAAGSLPFLPEETMATLRHMRTAYGDRIWKRYGFVDAFNPETGWINPDVIGIDVGISLLQIENARTGKPWAWFMRAKEARAGLERAGFASTDRMADWTRRDALLALAHEAWRSLDEPGPSRDRDTDTLADPLRLSAVTAASALGFLDTPTTTRHLLAALETPPPIGDSQTEARYAAGLFLARQAVPALAPQVEERLARMTWNRDPAAVDLAASDRLAVFLRIANGIALPSEWTALRRESTEAGTARVLAPADTAGHLYPGLWLDERDTLVGASASQLAWSLLPGIRSADTPPDALTAALVLEHFPTEVADRLPRGSDAGRWLSNYTRADRTALLLALANLLAGDAIRQWFQADEVVRRGREAVAEFAVAAFGARNSLFQVDELAPPPVVPPQRVAVAVPASTPRDQWQWNDVAGLEFVDSGADIRAGDPELSLRFAFTYDSEHLVFHAIAVDTPEGFQAPAGRRGVELFLDPAGDGLEWGGSEDFQFLIGPGLEAAERFNSRRFESSIETTDTGYEVSFTIPWSETGLQPRPGLALGFTAAVAADGANEWSPSLKLNWRFHRRADGRFDLAILQLR
jgi:hypothetical protein